ncbi:hypothetical protein PtA15_7A460 [Puccinia triticina]|uniref:Uncharacterized protein n=1 Tax=Puccinia triticina TaxID=208348 RepID=A0ABY7CRZ2_9BASI|nr:uncharacterized protein PtA15_7A460 [Puccinia triticina]WAQ86732.1 hypothetical protein PtA15_7A460 [Puccinia triticina]
MPALRQLNTISRLLFDAPMSPSSSSAKAHCSRANNYFLALPSITVESHWLALFHLPMFYTGWVKNVGPDCQARRRSNSVLHVTCCPCAGRPPALVPQLEELLRGVVEGHYALKQLAKSSAESLLQANPAVWPLALPDPLRLLDNDHSDAAVLDLAMVEWGASWDLSPSLQSADLC